MKKVEKLYTEYYFFSPFVMQNQTEGFINVLPLAILAWVRGERPPYTKIKLSTVLDTTSVMGPSRTPLLTLELSSILFSFGFSSRVELQRCCEGFGDGGKLSLIWLRDRAAAARARGHCLTSLLRVRLRIQSEHLALVTSILLLWLFEFKNCGLRSI